MSIKKIAQYSSITLLLVTGLAFAVSSPLTMMQGVANKMLVSLHNHKAQLDSSRGDKIIHDIVEANLVPHVDLTRMAASVVGRQYWSGATSEQKKTFVTEFKDLVIATYSGALSSYNDDVVEFYPLRGGYAGKTAVQIRSVIVRKSGQRIALNYNLALRNNDWRIYDFTIEGVSMVQSYRSQFASALSQGGMTQLLQQLKTHNQAQ